MSLGDKFVVGIDPPVLDYRKWKLFLVTNNLDMEEGRTMEYMWNLRLRETLQQAQQFRCLENFPPAQYPRMLIIGCGIGAEIRAFENLGYKVIGIGFLNLAQYEYAIEQGVDMRIMDMHDLRFPNESFDVVYCSHTFEHCLHPWLMCMEVWAVLRRGGRWWINLPTWREEGGPSKEHYMILPPWFMKPLLEKCGFRILYSSDESTKHQYLLEKVGLEEMIDPKSIRYLLSKRLEIG